MLQFYDGFGEKFKLPHPNPLPEGEGTTSLHFPSILSIR